MYFVNKLKLVLVPSVFIIAGIIAWLLTNAVFSHWTEDGNIYSSSLKIDTSGYSSERVLIQGTEDYYDRFWLAEEQLYEFDVYIGGTTALVIYIGYIEDVVKKAQMSRVDCYIEQPLGYAVFWIYSGTATRNLRDLYGMSSSQGCKTIIGFTKDSFFSPNARNVDLVIPTGGLNPLILLLLDQAMKGLNTSMDSKISKAMNIQLVGEITSKLGLKKLNEDIKPIAFKYGPIQYLTVFLMLFCLVILAFSIFQPWAVFITEGMLDLIPYVGFFGTLLGMGAALSILGDANLSDPISKAISLGPIGSKLSLAIETTKFALVCFGLGTFCLVVRKSFHKQNNSDFDL